MKKFKMLRTLLVIILAAIGIVISFVVALVLSACMLTNECVSIIGILTLIFLVYLPFIIVELNQLYVQHIQPFEPYVLLIIVLIIGYFITRSSKGEQNEK